MGLARVRGDDDHIGGRAAPVPGDRADEDTRLMLRVAQRDERAFAALVSRHHARIFGLCRRMLADDSEAEDVSQDVFLKLWTQSTAWRPDGARFTTWLHRVAANACIDRLRKKVPEPIASVPEQADDRPGPSAALQTSQVAARVEAAIASLPERQRLALVLTYYQGLSNREAADTLDVNVDALESLLARGRRKLKDELAGEWRELLGD